jgi:hypothetical protein
MSTGSYFDTDGLQRFYGTSKAIPEQGGEYRTVAGNRTVDILIDLSTLNTSTATIVSYNTFFPSLANVAIESVVLFAETAMSTGSSPTLSVGVIGQDQATVPTNGGTAFASSVAASALAAGDVVTLTAGVSGAGNYVGTSQSTGWTTPQYITAKLGTATATGKIRVRINYHGVGTIPF